jgi:hypothetical protein
MIMTLSILIGEKPTAQDGQLLMPVIFTFGHDAECCYLPLGYWRLQDYLSQWVEGLSRVSKSNGRSALITSISHPSVAANVVAWLFYPIDHTSIAIQQHLLFHAKVILQNGMMNYSALPDRETHSEDGYPISEWAISNTDIDNGIDQLSAYHFQ